MNWILLLRIIKWAVPFLIALILYKKFVGQQKLSLQVFMLELRSLPLHFFFLVTSASLLNWYIETRKWQFLMRKLQKFTLRTSLKSVLSGVAVSQLLPYRTGEYLGRLAFVRSELLVKAGVLSVAGSFSQLCITILIGLPAFLLLKPIDIPYELLFYLSLFFILLIPGFRYLNKIKYFRNSGLMKQLKLAINLLSFSDWSKLFLLSFLRYLSFLIPYALIAQYYGVGRGDVIYYYPATVACIYFLQTISPSFILTDIAIRIGISAIVFSGSSDVINGVDHLPGMIIYLFNVALPMCAGAIIVFLIRVRK